MRKAQVNSQKIKLTHYPKSDRGKGWWPDLPDEEHWCRGELARDARGMAVCPLSESAVKRCGLGAVIAAAYQLTHDFDAAHQLGHEPCVHIMALPRSFMSMT
jgi:hypothetical protein